LDWYAERLEDLRYILRRANADPVEAVAAVRQKALIMLTPYVVLPQVKPLHFNRPSSSHEDWFQRIYQACSHYETAGVVLRDNLTKQEKLPANSIDGVQGEVCASLARIWATAFDSEDRPVLAGRMVAEWKADVEALIE
jgi:hypothetical protein